MIVACDTFDHTDFPVLVGPDDDFFEIFGSYNAQGDKMLRVMEVYDLRQPCAEQLAEFRAWRIPK